MQSKAAKVGTFLGRVLEDEGRSQPEEERLLK